MHIRIKRSPHLPFSLILYNISYANKSGIHRQFPPDPLFIFKSNIITFSTFYCSTAVVIENECYLFCSCRINRIFGTDINTVYMVHTHFLIDNRLCHTTKLKSRRVHNLLPEFFLFFGSIHNQTDFYMSQSYTISRYIPFYILISRLFHFLI